MVKEPFLSRLDAPLAIPTQRLLGSLIALVQPRVQRPLQGLRNGFVAALSAEHHPGSMAADGVHLAVAHGPVQCSAPLSTLEGPDVFDTEGLGTSI